MDYMVWIESESTTVVQTTKIWFLAFIKTQSGTSRGCLTQVLPCVSGAIRVDRGHNREITVQYVFQRDLV